MTPSTVAGFILLNPQFPRSLPHCVANIEATLAELLRNEDLKGVDFPREPLDTLRGLSSRTPETVIASGMHEYLDEVQVALNLFDDQVSTTFFHASD